MYANGNDRCQYEIIASSGCACLRGGEHVVDTSFKIQRRDTRVDTRGIDTVCASFLHLWLLRRKTNSRSTYFQVKRSAI